MDKKVVIGIIAAVVVVGGGIGVYMVMDKKKKAAALASKVQSTPKSSIKLPIKDVKLSAYLSSVLSDEEMKKLASYILMVRKEGWAEAATDFGAVKASLYQLGLSGQVPSLEGIDIQGELGLVEAGLV